MSYAFITLTVTGVSTRVAALGIAGYVANGSGADVYLREMVITVSESTAQIDSAMTSALITAFITLTAYGTSATLRVNVGFIDGYAAVAAGKTRIFAGTHRLDVSDTVASIDTQIALIP